MIKDYKDLIVWNEAMDLVERLYKEILPNLPADEKYSLSSQIRRSAISVPSNIAEGNSRQYTKEYIQFLYIALGSASELETQIILLNRLHNFEIENFLLKIKSIKKMLNKLISTLKRK